MPENMYTTWLWVTSTGTLLACSGVVLLTMQVWHLVRENTRRAATIESLRNTLITLRKETLHTGKVQAELFHKLKGLDLRQEQLELQQPEARPYSHAIELVKKGAAIDDLVAACGLSHNEAELIMTIHGMYETQKH